MPGQNGWDRPVAGVAGLADVSEGGGGLRDGRWDAPGPADLGRPALLLPGRVRPRLLCLRRLEQHQAE